MLVKDEMKSEEEDFIEYNENSEVKSFQSLRVDNELFKDDSYIPNTIINVKRIKLPKNGEDWEILENNKVKLTLKGIRFTAAERSFFHTIEGMRFLIEQYKLGAKSVLKIKEALKKIGI